MTASAKDRLIVVAQLVGAFGVRGEARVRSFTAEPDACFSYGPLLDADGNVVITAVSARPLGEAFGVTTQQKVEREHWEALRGTLLHVPRSALPEPDDDEVYVEDLVGLDVMHIDGRRLGEVAGTQNFGAGDLLEVNPDQGSAFFLPFTKEIVPEIDLEGGKVIVAPGEDYLPDAFKQPDPNAQT